MKRHMEALHGISFTKEWKVLEEYEANDSKDSGESNTSPKKEQNRIPYEALGFKKYKNPIWQYFRKLPDEKAECSICLKVLSVPKGTTTSCNRHLEALHDIKIPLKKDLIKFD